MKYIGARYMPKFMGLYDATTSYEALSVVDNGMGTSYVANKPVPAGTPLNNTDYWAIYGATSGAIINLQNQIDKINDTTIKYYNTVADMVAEDLQINEVIATRGYYAVDDGGAALYTIKAATSRLHETLNNGNVAELSYYDTVSVLQLGAVGDGVTDDLAIFQAAISAVPNVIVPGNHTYKLSAALTIPAHHRIAGEVDIMTSLQPLIEFDTGGMIVSGNMVTIEDISISTLDSSNPAVFVDTSTDSVEFLKVKNCYLSGGSAGFKTEGTKAAWMINLENVRVNQSSVGFELRRCSPCVTLINCYSHKCGSPLECYTTNATFIGCNFSFYNGNSIQIRVDTQSHVEFEGCNFECDEAVSNSTLFYLVSQSAKFSNCHFNILAGSGSSFLSCTSGTTMALFEGCWMTTKTGHDPSFQFIELTGMRCAKYGAIVYGKGSFNLPRPTGMANTYYPYFVDMDSDCVPHFITTNITTSLLSQGSLLYSETLNKLCYFDGTNVKTVDDNTIVV